LQATIAASIHSCCDGSSVIGTAITLGTIVLDVAKDGIPATSERRNALVFDILEPVGVDTYSKAGYSREKC
jgi:hypothetical protein